MQGCAYFCGTHDFPASGLLNAKLNRQYVLFSILTYQKKTICFFYGESQRLFA